MSNKGKFYRKATAVAGSLASVSLVAGSADAGIIHVNDRPISVAPGSKSNLDWDIDGDGAFNIRFDFFSYAYYSILFQARNLNRILGGTGELAVDANGRIVNLSTGSRVSATLGAPLVFDDAIGYIIKLSNALAGFSADFDINVPGFVGFKFNDGAKDLYGWASFAVTTGSPAQLAGITISEWAYEDSGGSILVGDTGSASVPEPSSLALLAMGVAGLTAWRRRRRPQSEDVTQPAA